MNITTAAPAADTGLPDFNISRRGALIAGFATASTAMVPAIAASAPADPAVVAFEAWRTGWRAAWADFAPQTREDEVAHEPLEKACWAAEDALAAAEATTIEGLLGQLCLMASCNNSDRRGAPDDYCSIDAWLPRLAEECDNNECGDQAKCRNMIGHMVHSLRTMRDAGRLA